MKEILFFLLISLCILTITIQKKELGAVSSNALPAISKTFVINLQKRAKRLKFVAHRLNELNIPFERFEAVDLGNGDPTHIRRAMQSFHPGTQFSEEAVRANLTALKGDLHFTWGAAGCWQSHLQIFMEIANSNFTGPFLILEDDVKISKRILTFLSHENLFHKLPPDWEVILLDHSCLECHPNTTTTDVCLVKFSYSTGAYVIRDREVAKKHIHYANTPHMQVADAYVNLLYRGKYLHAYAVLRKVVAQARSILSTDIKLDPAALKTTRYNETLD